jgi:hypothetical protein
VSLEVFLVEAAQPLRILRDRTDAQDRVAEDLELLGDHVIETWIVVVRAVEHEDRDAVLVLDGLEDRVPLVLDVLFVSFEGVPGFLAGVRVAPTRVASLRGLPLIRARARTAPWRCSSEIKGYPRGVGFA